MKPGPREFDEGSQSGFDGASDVPEMLAALSRPEEVIGLRPTPGLSARIAELIAKSRAGQMTARDEEDWERYEHLEHLVRMAKAAAQFRLSRPNSDA